MTDSGKRKIFVVEDDTELVDMLSAFFRAQGYEISASVWGEEAVQLIQEWLPDVVLLDIRLPDIDGYEVCRRLRRTRRTRHLPIIFLTERRERGDRLAGLELGAVDYITKPFDIQELRLRVRNALRRSDLQALHNPITGLPEGLLVKERLEDLLQEPAQTWGLVFAGVHGLEAFRDRYGFVAADDVTRAVGLMIADAAREDDSGEAFIGHINPEEFVVLTEAAYCEKLAERCRARLEPSVQYFYPASDRDQVDDLPDAERLSIQVATLRAQDGDYQSVSELGEALQALLV